MKMIIIVLLSLLYTIGAWVKVFSGSPVIYAALCLLFLFFFAYCVSLIGNSSAE